MIWDWTINPIAIMQLAVFILGGVWFLSKVRGDVNVLQLDFSEFKKEFAKLTVTIGTIAVAEEKIAGVNQRLEDEKGESSDFRQWVRSEITEIWRAIREGANALTFARMHVTP